MRVQLFSDHRKIRKITIFGYDLSLKNTSCRNTRGKERISTLYLSRKTQLFEREEPVRFTLAAAEGISSPVISLLISIDW